MDVHGILVWFAIWPVAASLCLHGTLSWFFRASSARCLWISNNSGVMRKTSAWRLATGMVGGMGFFPQPTVIGNADIYRWIYIYISGVLWGTVCICSRVCICYTMLNYSDIYMYISYQRTTSHHWRLQYQKDTVWNIEMNMGLPGYLQWLQVNRPGRPSMARAAADWTMDRHDFNGCWICSCSSNSSMTVQETLISTR